MCSVVTSVTFSNNLGNFEKSPKIKKKKKLKNLKEIYSKIDSVESERDLWFAKGQVSILRQMIALEEATKLAVEELDI